VGDELARPFRGIEVPSLVPDPAGAVATADTAPIVEAARELLALLDDEQRTRLVHPLDDVARRQWFNVHPNVMRHGLLLEDLSPAARDAAMQLMGTTLSARGFAQARDVMRINGLLVEITGRPDEFGEWPYFLSLFGTPDRQAPWAWQIDGHHLNVNACVVGDQLSITPTFMGSEPCVVPSGVRCRGRRRAGLRALARRGRVREGLPGAVDPARRPAARAERPDRGAHGRRRVPRQRGRTAGRHPRRRAVGRPAPAAARGRGGLRRLGARRPRRAEVERHLDETTFAWMGAVDDEGPFYFRALSPVVLVEFDHHPGIVFDNLEPSRHHVHTVVRTPNGADYGADLLARHHDRFDHRHGRHDAH
jgi:hypothetical protein